MTTKQEKSAADLVGEKKAQVKDEAAREVAKDAVKDEIALDTGTTAPDPDPKANRFQGSDEIQMYAHLLDNGIEGLKRVIDQKDGIPEEKVAGLLILERNGQNRTEFVKALIQRLGIKDIKTELPQAGGPDYTHDTTNLSDL
jgi:hypothetical protein